MDMQTERVQQRLQAVIDENEGDPDVVAITCRTEGEVDRVTIYRVIRIKRHWAIEEEGQLYRYGAQFAQAGKVLPGQFATRDEAVNHIQAMRRQREV